MNNAFFTAGGNLTVGLLALSLTLTPNLTQAATPLAKLPNSGVPEATC